MGKDRLPPIPPRDPENTPEQTTDRREEAKNKAVERRREAAPNLKEKPLLLTTVFDGYGKVEYKDGKLVMAPKTSTLKRKSPNEFQETHGSLVVSNENYKQPFCVSFTMKTTKQLRENEPPNAWEVGWIVFGYKDDGSDNGKFNYIILKPDGLGVEVGRSLLNDEQEFLYTSEPNKDQFPINKDYNVVMNIQNNVVTMTVNGKKYPPYDVLLKSSKNPITADGKIGFYTEDAAVEVSNIRMEKL